MNDHPISTSDPHRKAMELLPWYANRTLSADETAWIEAHLAQCPDCRGELALEREIASVLPASSPLPDTDAGWAAMLGRVQAAPAPAPNPPATRQGNVVAFLPRAFLRRPVPLGWAIAAQAAVVVLMMGTGQSWLARSPTGPEYHALSSPSANGGANLLVMFRPDLREADLRRILLSNKANIAGGPNASGAYQLHVATGTLTSVIARLRADPKVTMAEAIDGGGQ